MDSTHKKNSPESRSKKHPGLFRKRGCWYIDYYDEHGKRRRKKSNTSIRIAKDDLEDMKAQVRRRKLGLERGPEVTEISHEDLFRDYLEYSKTNHAPASYKRYRTILEHFKEFTNNYPVATNVSRFSSKIFEDYKALRKQQGAASKTINIELGVFRAVFYKAIEWKHLKENPLKGVKMLKEDRSRQIRFLSREESKALLENCGPNLYPVFYTLLATGMRKGELEHLEWRDIDFDRRKIKILIKTNWRPKTTEREIPINNGLMEVLLKHREKSKRGSLVFQEGGKPIEPSKLRKELMKITKKCGFPDVTKLHSLRHTFASYLVMNGIDLTTVKRLMGHSNIETTMIYAHLAEEHVDKAVETLEF